MAKDIDTETWYIHMDGEPRGPLSIRDLDVLLRTNEITSKTLGWKAGMKQWKALIDIQQLKDSIQESSKELIQITQKKTTMLDQKKSKFGPNKTQQKAPQQQPLIDQDNQDPQQDPMLIIAATVQNLVKNSFHQSEDGKWNIYDEEKKEWFTQVDEPKEQIEAMKNALLEKLKTELFSNKKETRKRRDPGEPQEVLTKEELEKRERNRKKTKRAAQKKKKKWYNPKINTFIYISGLPPSITQDQLKQFSSRAGVIRIDPQTGKQKIKIYRDDNGVPKGDAAISYTKEESIGIALEMLNEREIKPGFVVRIERAQFNQKNEQYKARESKRMNKVEKALAKKNQGRMLSWNQEEAGDGLKIVILKNMFTLDQLGNQQLLAETKQDIQTQCQKIGPLQRIRYFETHPQGVVQVKFKQEADAQKCIDIMNGRFFDGREIECAYWDGETNYKTAAGTQMVENSRIDEFGNWLEGGGAGEPRKQIKFMELSLADLEETAPILPGAGEGKPVFPTIPTQPLTDVAIISPSQQQTNPSTIPPPQNAPPTPPSQP